MSIDEETKQKIKASQKGSLSAGPVDDDDDEDEHEQNDDGVVPETHEHQVGVSLDDGETAIMGRDRDNGLDFSAADDRANTSSIVNNNENDVVPETREHQVGVSLDGETAIMGRDRGTDNDGGGDLELDFAVADERANSNNNNQEQQQQQETNKEEAEIEAINLDDLPQKKKNATTSPSTNKKPHVDPMAGVVSNNTNEEDDQDNIGNNNRDDATSTIVAPLGVAPARQRDDETPQYYSRQQPPKDDDNANSSNHEIEFIVGEDTPAPKETLNDDNKKSLELTPASPDAEKISPNRETQQEKQDGGESAPQQQKELPEIDESSPVNQVLAASNDRHTPPQQGPDSHDSTARPSLSDLQASGSLNNNNEANKNQQQQQQQREGADAPEEDEWAQANAKFELAHTPAHQQSNSNNNNDNDNPPGPLFSPATVTQDGSTTPVSSPNIGPKTAEVTQQQKQQQRPNLQSSNNTNVVNTAAASTGSTNNNNTNNDINGNNTNGLIQVNWKNIQQVLLNDAELIAGPATSGGSAGDESFCSAICSCLFEQSNAERDLPLLLMMAKIPMAHNNANHENLMKSIRVSLLQLSLADNAATSGTSSSAAAAGILPSYDSLGFQSNDPANDLRGTGMLGLLQWYYLIKRYPELAGPMWRDATSETHSFQFALASFEMTAIVLAAMRTGCLTQLIDEREKAVIEIQKEEIKKRVTQTKSSNNNNNNNINNANENNGLAALSIPPERGAILMLFAHDLYCGLMRHFYRVWKAAPTRQVMDFPPIRALLKKIVQTDPVSVMYSSPVIPLAPTTFAAATPGRPSSSSSASASHSVADPTLNFNQVGPSSSSSSSSTYSKRPATATNGGGIKKAPPSPSRDVVVERGNAKRPPTTASSKLTPRNGKNPPPINPQQQHQGGSGGSSPPTQRPPRKTVSMATVGANSKDDEGFSSI